MNPILGYSFIYIFLIGVIECGQWKYKGPTGPQKWHELFPSACAGTAQSPIDIKPERTIYNPDLKDFALWYDPPKPGSRMKIKNNGHAIQVNTEGEFYVTNGGLYHVYKVAQFHFHWGSEDHMGSEHLLDSVAYPIEMHIVSYNSDLYGDLAEAVTEKGGLAVLGVLFEVQEKPNPVYDPIIKALEHVKDPGEDREEEIEALSLRNLLPEDISKYYRYNGSLTTPNCFETVTWTVFHQKQKISFGQLMKFRKVLQHRHKHNHHKKHKRWTKNRQTRAAEEGARAVLEEIGIKSDAVQKGELISSLIDEQKQTHMNANENHHHSKNTANTVQDPQLTKVSVDEETAKRADESMKEYTDRLSGSTAPEPNHEDTPLWIQDNLVDNYRPVQPLNDRIVYRSFKLKDIYMPQNTYNVQQNSQPNHAQPPQKTAKVATVYSEQNGNNSAGSLQFSFVSLIFVFIISLL